MKKIIGIFVLVMLAYSTQAFARATAEREFYFTTSDSVKLYVRVTGQGSPCVFIHGGPGSTSNYFEKSEGSQVEQFLQMIYFDQRGSGRSESARNGNYSIARLEKDLEELRRYLGYPRWSVMGHSFAGILMTNYLDHYSRFVSSAIYVNCTLNLPYSINSHISFGINELGLTDKAYTDPAINPMERLGKVHEQLNEKGVWYKLMFATPEAKVVSDSITLSIGRAFNYDYGNKVWGYTEYQQDFTPLTAHIKVPVLVMAGQKDHAVGPEHYTSFRFPNVRTVLYEGGHCPFQESGAWFAATIRLFMQEQGKRYSSRMMPQKTF
ncbi:alpha/beta hydrolase [Telluribacter sp.]|jgi:proline iminopeptidase|uniref:alpha/beta fold hydrolase n=1 Tax=Telluribacter sp. TaxID=1978767 RepID=UPI002E124EF0|nr:alpha/beta hydrolase [Telluribacter sp.]